MERWEVIAERAAEVLLDYEQKAGRPAFGPTLNAAETIEDIARRCFGLEVICGSKGTERLLSEDNISERQLDLARSYYETYPRAIDEALEENARTPEERHEFSPSVIPAPPTRG